MKGECADKRGSGGAGNFGAVYRMDLDVSRGRPRPRLNRVTGGGGVGRAGRGGTKRRHAVLVRVPLRSRPVGAPPSRRRAWRRSSGGPPGIAGRGRAAGG